MAGIKAGSGGKIQKKRRHFHRAHWGTFGSASIIPAGGASDYRESGGYACYPPDFDVPDWEIDGYTYTMKINGVNQTPVTILKAAVPLTGTFPSDAGDDEYSVGVVAYKDTPAGRRYSNNNVPLWSEVVVVIVGLHAPQNTAVPVLTTPGEATDYGVIVTCPDGTWTGTPAPTFTKQWRRGGVAISGETGNTYQTVVADVGQLTCTVTPHAGGVDYPALAVTTAPITITSSAITPPGYISAADYEFVELPGTGGQRRMNVGTAKSGGSAISFNTAVFDLVRMSGGAPITSFASNASTVNPTSDTFDFTTTFADGSVRYHSLGYQLKADRTQWWPALDPTGTVSIGGVLYPLGTVVIGAGVVAPLTPSQRLGEFSSPLAYSEAIAAPIGGSYVSGSGSIANKMNPGYSAFSYCTLALGVMLGDSGCRTRAATALQTLLRSDTLCPLFAGGFFSNVGNPMASLMVVSKYDTALNALLTANDRLRRDAAMEVALWSGAFGSSDNNPWASGETRTIRGWPGGGGGEDQKTTAANQSLQSPASALMGLAYAGSVSAANVILAKTPADIIQDLRDAGFGAAANLCLTMDWRNSGFSGTRALGTDTIGSAPTSDQIVAACGYTPATGVSKYRYWGRTLSEYHDILALMTAKRDPAYHQNVSIWIGIGEYGSLDYKYKPTAAGLPTLVTIDAGWGKNGLKADKSPAGTRATGVYGCLSNKSLVVPFTGYTGALGELFDEQDDGGRRSSPHYAIDGWRAVFPAMLSLYAADMLSMTNASMVEILPIVYRGTVSANFLLHNGFISFDHGAPGPSWPDEIPSNQDWQLNSTFQAFYEVLGPAVGCGQVVKALTQPTRWSGITGTRAIAGGKLVFTAAGTADTVSQSIPLLAAHYYEVEFTVSSFSAGGVKASFTGGTSVVGTTRTANGTYKQRLMAGTGNNTLVFTPSAAGTSLSINDTMKVTGPFETSTVGGD